MNFSEIAFLTAEFVVGLLAILTNGIVVLTYIRTPKLHTVRNYFILSIASADMLAGVVIPSTSILAYMQLPKHFYGCLVVHTLIITCTGISIFNLLALSIDRCIYIKCPNNYDKVLCHRNAVIFLVGTWIVALLVGFNPVYYWHPPEPDSFNFCTFRAVISKEFLVFVYIFVVQGFAFVTLLVLLIVMYRKLYKEMALASEMLPFDDQEENRKFKRELTAITFIFVIFVVCYAPIDIVDILGLLRPDVKLPFVVIMCFVLLCRTRAFTTTYFYVYGDKDLQRTIVQTVPLTIYIVPRMGDNVKKRSNINKYLSENPVEIVQVVLTSPPKLQARDAFVDTEPLTIYTEPVVLPPPPTPVTEEEQVSDTETSTESSEDQ